MLTFKPFETSASWHFPDPDTGYKHLGGSREELIRNIVNYRANNHLEPLTRLDLVLENYLCCQPENAGKCMDIPLKRGLLQYLKGGVALLQNLMYSSFVEQDVADARASICVPCCCNTFPDRDVFIQWSDTIALNSVGDRHTVHDEKLGSCLACSCVLRAKCWYPGPYNLSEEERGIMNACNPGCWQLKEK